MRHSGPGSPAGSTSLDKVGLFQQCDSGTDSPTVAVTTGISFGGANLIATLATVKSNLEPTPGIIIGIYAAILVSHGLINTFGVKLLRYLNNSSILLHSLGIGSFAIALVAAAPTRQPASFVFANFNDATGVDAPGWSERASPAYVAVCGILLAQYTVSYSVVASILANENRLPDSTHPRIYRKRHTMHHGVPL